MTTSASSSHPLQPTSTAKASAGTGGPSTVWVTVSDVVTVTHYGLPTRTLTTRTIPLAASTIDIYDYTNIHHQTHIVATTFTTLVYDVACSSCFPTPTQSSDLGHHLSKRCESDGSCYSGIYCVNSTAISYAPPNWDWPAMLLSRDEVCLDDVVYGTEYVEEMCGCAGLI